MTRFTCDIGKISAENWPPREGVGGQHVGIVTGVRVTHEQSGLQAFCNWERSRHRNREVALDMLRGGLTSFHFSGDL